MSVPKAITSADGFHHLVYSISGTTHTLFLDGSSVSINTNAVNIFSTFPNISNLFFGTAGDLSYGYTGFLDDVKIFNRALSAIDVSAIFNNQSSPISASVVGSSIIPIPSLSKSYVAFSNTTGTNTIMFNQTVTANVFMIGGGGAGAGPHGGGGGAGAYYNNTFTFNANTTYTIIVGAGGVYAGQNLNGGNGGNTIITTGGVNQLIVNGGGGGGYGPGINGGCGSGAGGVNSVAHVGGSAVNTSTNGTGFAGGSKTTNYSGGGGGGAGSVGQNAGVRSSSSLNGGNGGNAIVVTLKGVSEAYGGGGGGGSWDNTGGTQSLGGSVLINGTLTYVGGYSNRCFDGSIIIAGTPPVTNTGSGGGGGGAFASYGTNGSAGIVIIQYDNSAPTTNNTDVLSIVTKYSNYYLWLDALSPSKVTLSSGNTISAWLGSNNGLGTSSISATYNTNPYSVYTIPSTRNFESSYKSTSLSETLFFVVSFPDINTASNKAVFLIAADTGTNSRSVQLTPNSLTLAKTDTGQSFTGNFPGTLSTITNNTKYLISISVNYMSNPASTAILRVNRTPLTIGSMTGTFEQNNGVKNSRFGYIYANYYSIPTINYHEIIGIGNSGIMSLSDIQSIETYLYNKWNL
jgi:hypothetical protein